VDFNLKAKVIRLVGLSLISTSLTLISIPQASAVVGATSPNALTNAALGVASLNAEASSGALLMPSMTATATARSVGLVAKSANTSITTGQTATVYPGGVLSLYAVASTTIAFSATGGVISATATSNTSTFAGTAPTTTTTAIAFTKSSASGTAETASVLWDAPTTAGTYTISLYIAAHPGTAAATPDSVDPLQGTLIGSVVVTVTEGSHPSVGGTNAPVTTGPVNASMFLAIATNNSGQAAVATSTTLGTGETDAKSLGILAKDTSYRTAQTATVLAGAKLSLYSQVSTSVAFSASGGSFSDSAGASSHTYSNDLKTTLLTGATNSARKTAVTIWTAPSTAGTYTVSMYVHDGTTAPTVTSPAVSLGGQITVTVVAASAGGSYSAAYSACNTNTITLTETATYPSGVDSTSRVADGGSWYIDFRLNDAYQQNLSSGNLVATATNGALVNIGTDAGSTPTAGTASTDVEFTDGDEQTVRVTQGTAGAPVTTTVTITYNGTTVCTKTVTIAGAATKLTIANVGTQDLGSATGATPAQWMYQQIGLYSAGLFTVLATDSAGNIVATPSDYGTFSADSATLTTVVQGITVPTLASTTGSSDLTRFSLGTWSCGSTAGQANVKIKFTITATGTVLTSDAFTARCADNAFSYTASFDKASYVQGDIAKLTVKFLDSKGNPANSVTAIGNNTMSLPWMTGINIATAIAGTQNPASTTAVTGADGSVTYTMTVGTTSGLTAGTYTGVVEFASPAGGVTATPTYKLTASNTDVSFTEVLKSVVALIASINKQIQALQKLITRKR